MKLITFAVPCYNSAAYMEKCIDSLLTAGEDSEIVIIDDGSTKDDTPAIADRYAAAYPDRIRTVHQPNGGHGAGVNRGLSLARGLYYKVVDSDDWLDTAALAKLMQLLRGFVRDGVLPDLLIGNYVYECEAYGTGRVIRFTNVFPENRIFEWDDARPMKIDQGLHMHSLYYRTGLLRDCGVELPHHTFYVDSLIAYVPLPSVRRLYYANLNLYRYFIGRADQSVNEAVILKRIDQQMRVVRLLIQSHHVTQNVESPRLQAYMLQYVNFLMGVCTVFTLIDASDEAMEKLRELWETMRDYDADMYRRTRRSLFGVLGRLRNRYVRWIPLSIYRAGRRIYRYN